MEPPSFFRAKEIHDEKVKVLEALAPANATDVSAQISFAEVVCENGETQVVDFNDRVHAKGVYSLLDFKAGRRVDHVRIVAKAATEETQIRVHLLS